MRLVIRERFEFSYTIKRGKRRFYWNLHARKERFFGADTRVWQDFFPVSTHMYRSPRLFAKISLSIARVTLVQSGRFFRYLYANVSSSAVCELLFCLPLKLANDTPIWLIKFFQNWLWWTILFHYKKGDLALDGYFSVYLFTRLTPNLIRWNI